MTKKSEVIYFLMLSGLLWAFLIYKAIVSPLLMDEATTFLEYANLWDILPGQANWRTNNHYLNSFLVALSTSVFGVNEWALRLPNLLAFLVFASYTWRWNQHVQDAVLRLLFPTAVFASLFYMEFFGLARGYGLSIAALYGGAYHQYKGFAEDALKDKKLSFIFMILAITANLNMQFIYLVWYALEVWNTRKALKHNWVYLLVRLIPIVLTVSVSFILKSKGALDSGQNLGLSETVKALTYVAIGKWDFWWWSVPLVFTVIVLLALAMRLKNSLEFKWKPFDVLFILLFGNIAVLLLSHLFFGIAYPNQRLASHWYILWLPLLFLSANYFNTIGKYFVAVMAVVFVLFQFNYWNTNFSFSRNSDELWKREQISNSFALDLKKMRDPEITLSGSFYHNRQWSFLQLKNDAYFTVQMQHSIFKDTLADFLLVKTELKNEYPIYEDYKEDNRSSLSLLRRKPFLSKRIVSRVDIENTDLEPGGNSLIGSFNYPAKGKQIGLRLEFNMHSDRSKVKSQIEVNVTNKKGYKYWEPIRLDKLYANLENRQVVLNLLVPSHNEEQLNFSIKIVNIDGVKCRIDKARCYFYELE